MVKITKKFKLVQDISKDEPVDDSSDIDDIYKYEHYVPAGLSDLAALLNSRTPEDYQKTIDRVKKEDEELFARWKEPS